MMDQAPLIMFLITIILLIYLLIRIIIYEILQMIKHKKNTLRRRNND